MVIINLARNVPSRPVSTFLSLRCRPALRWGLVLAIGAGTLVHWETIESGDMNLGARLEGPTANPFVQIAENKDLIPLETTPLFNRDVILNDELARIAPEFKIPAGLRDRAGFWFDVYSKYNSNNRIIHDSRYPWIVYKVIDVTSIIEAETPRHRWMRNEKADNFVKAEANKVRAALRALAKRKDGVAKTEDEKSVAAALEKLGGKLNRQAKRSAEEVRVQTGQRDFFLGGLRASPVYLAQMEEIFRAHRLPIELTRIPFVESSFNGRATSKVGASGIWQFTASTGKLFMRVDGVVDERRSPLKATEGAARLLAENHLILHRSWPLAVSAWNHGPPGIRKACQSAGSKDLSVVIAKYRSSSFDFASSNFYSEFLGALHAERYGREIFGKVETEPALQATKFLLPRRSSIKDLLRSSLLNREEFLALNPELEEAAKKNAILPKGFRILVPNTHMTDVEKSFAVQIAGKNEI